MFYLDVLLGVLVVSLAAFALGILNSKYTLYRDDDIRLIVNIAAMPVIFICYITAVVIVFFINTYISFKKYNGK